MKRMIKRGVVLACVLAMLTGCGQQGNTTGTEGNAGQGTTDVAEKKVFEGATVIELSDEEISVDGNAVTEDRSQAVYVANDIIFYLEGQGFTYGEGTEADEHPQEEADTHTVVHITKPGTYAVSGQLSAGQIAIDLGEDAEENPEAAVNLILNGVDITCTVAPAVIFYNVYECGAAEAEGASKDVDTTEAGANVLIADGTVNNVTGSYVARIYKSYTLNEAGTEVVDNKKLHKYDAAFYSKMSMNVNGDEFGTGVLNITAENEGLDSELHLTISGGNINIVSGNDGINTNEDEVSVTTVNGGTLTIKVTGETGEGDGIDSNGWLVMNGGTIIAEACSISGDAGIDSDMGIHINGGTVMATGNMLDRISESAQNFVVFSFASRQNGGETYTLKNETGEVVFACTPENDFTYLILSSKKLTAGTYTLWCGEKQLAAGTGGMMGGFPGGRMPEGMELPEGVEVPEGFPGGERLEGMEIPKGAESPEAMEKLNEFPNGRIPEGMEPPKGMEKPEGDRGGFGGRGDRGQDGFGAMDNAELSTEITIVDGGNYFNNVSLAE